MYIGEEKYTKAWDFIRQDSEGGGCTVLILVGPDVDAMAACKILTSLFQSDLISYKVKPIYSYEDLHSCAEELITKNEELRSLFLLNCGGSIDLAKFLVISEDVTVYVCDSHRPHHLKNIKDKSGKILLFADQDDLSLSLPESTGSSDEEEEEEEEEEEDYEEDYGEEEEEEERKKTRKRKREKEKRMKKIPGLSLAKRNRKYYMVNGYGVSASTSLYRLAYRLSRRNNDLLWYAILGLTDQYLHNRIDQRSYFAEVDQFRKDVRELNYRDEDDDSSSSSSLSDGAIVIEEDYKFSLYRHWSLHEAMRHSPYVATRLEIWKPSGEQRLLTLLAKMGIPLEQCQQTFSLMKREFKDVLQSKIFQYAEEFRIPEVSFLSFTRRTNSNLILSASDAVLSLSSLSEIGDIVHSPQYSSFLSSSSSSLLGGREGGEREGEVVLSLLGGRGGGEKEKGEGERGEGERERGREERERWEGNFWVGFDGLSCCSSQSKKKNSLLLREGLQLAMIVQKAVVRQAIELIKRKVIVRSGPFRYCLLTHHESDSSHDLSLFSHPLALSQLATFLQNCLSEGRERERGERDKSKPFLVGVLNESKGTYLVLGVAPSSSSSSSFAFSGNLFGYYFLEAVEKTKAEIVVHLFDRSLVEIPSDQIGRFIGYIHLHMAS